MKVNEFMTTKIEFVEDEGTVYDAIEKMVDKRIRSLVVRLPHDDKRQGVITARDVVFRVLAKGIDPKTIKAASVASKPLKSIEQDAELLEAAALMEKDNIARLFVSKGDKIIGVISLIDLMAANMVARARGEYVS